MISIFCALKKLYGSDTSFFTITQVVKMRYNEPFITSIIDKYCVKVFSRDSHTLRFDLWIKDCLYGIIFQFLPFKYGTMGYNELPFDNKYCVKLFSHE